MVYIAIVIGYCLALFLLIRLFDAMHHWDEDVDEMMDEIHKELKQKAA
ncbi:MAG: hypothetical protein WAV76_15365 [Bacteroidota bacterium]